MGLNKINASMSFLEKDYYEVIELLQNASRSDFDVIHLLSKSYFAVGEFMKAYEILDYYFDTTDPIQNLTNTSKKEAYPFGAEIYKAFGTDESVQKMLENVRKAGWNLISTKQTNPELTLRDRSAVERYIGFAKKYLAGNDDYDCFVGLLFMEVAVAIAEEPRVELYELKCQLLERVYSIFPSGASVLLQEGYRCIRKKCNSLRPSYLLKVNDLFPIKGRGIVVTGIIEREEISRGEALILKRASGEKLKIKVAAIEMNGGLFDKALVGDSVGIFIQNLTENEVNIGDVLIKAV